MKKDIRAFGYEELKKEVESMGEKAFRAKPIRKDYTKSFPMN